MSRWAAALVLALSGCADDIRPEPAEPQDFGAELAETRLRAQVGADAVLARDARLDLDGLWAFRRLDGPQGVAWVGAGRVLSSDRSSDLPELLRLAGAGAGEGIDPARLGRLYVAFTRRELREVIDEVSRPRFAGKSGVDRVAAPFAEAVTGGVRYRFSTGDQLGDIEHHEVVVEPDGAMR